MDARLILPQPRGFQARFYYIVQIDIVQGQTVIITCVHQSSELYGSDRSFADAVFALRKFRPQDEIKVILPAPGPLTDVISKSGAKIRFEKLWILRKANRFRLIWNVLILPIAVAKARRQIRQSDITYINTVVIIDYIIAARLQTRGKVIIHVREIAPSPFRFLFRLILRLSATTLVYNSEATQKSYAIAANREHVIHNGFQLVPKIPEPACVSRALRLLLIGRINTWKGQDLLLIALSLMNDENRRGIQVRIVGDVYEGRGKILEELLSMIQEFGLADTVTIERFVTDPAPLYEWCDLVVVPSRQPEPFGRVAIEGMAYSRPILAAAHGGLSEIVMDGQTGWLFTPNDPMSLAKWLEQLVNNPTLVERAGVEARRRFEEKFTLQRTQPALMQIFTHVAAERGRH